MTVKENYSRPSPTLCQKIFFLKKERKKKEKKKSSDLGGLLILGL